MSLVVMATGGTGGHIYPAVATARELMARGHEVCVLGQRGGMEERVVPEQGLRFVGVDAGKLARSGQGRPDPRELWRAAQGIAQARRWLARERPGAVVGYGGFASLPGVLAAQTLGIPTLLHEQNARLGLTQRLAAGRARAVGTVYDRVLGLDPAKAVQVGMPVREDRVGRAEALGRLGLQSGPLTLLVMGGSQGSLFLNNALPDTLTNVLGREGLLPAPAGQPGGGQAVQVLHATGPRWLAEVAPRVRDLGWYHAVGFVDAALAWSAADLAVTRAGTGTLAEAAFHGVPLIMVPLPESAEDHQRHNARRVQEAGAGVLVEQRDVQEKLGQAVLECAAPSAREALRRAAQARSQPGAAARFADLIERELRAPGVPQ